MDQELSRTSRGQPRCTSPDGVKGKKFYLIKGVSLMRLTYQVRLLSRFAEENRCKLVIVLPRDSRVSLDLDAFVAARRWIKVVHR